MKNLKHIVFAIVVLPLVTIASYYLYEITSYTIAIIPLAFFAFNIAVIKSLLFKNYFTSRYNILTTKSNTETFYEIPTELMFHKIIEVINNSKLKLAKSDKESLLILATSKLTFTSWGENLYISLEPKDNGTTIKICTLTIFQVYSWGNVEKTQNYLLTSLENSLIV